MNKKQDRTHARTAAELERKYNLGRDDEEAKNIAAAAQRAANEAIAATAKLSEEIDQIALTGTVKHEWDGTTLIITSSSGTSSADLKGEKGEGGADGVNGTNGADGKDGVDGVDGKTPTFMVESNILYVSYDDGASWDELGYIGGANGEDGATGENGADGVGIESIEQTTTSTDDAGNNIITVTLTDGQTYSFAVQNGSKGDKGDKGDTGEAGKSAYESAKEGGYTGTEAEFNAKLAASYTYGTEDLTAGTSTLATGQLHFVYE